MSINMFQQSLFIYRLAPTIMIASQGKSKDLTKHLKDLSKDIFKQKHSSTEKEYAKDTERLFQAFGGVTSKSGNPLDDERIKND